MAALCSKWNVENLLKTDILQLVAVHFIVTVYVIG